MPKNIFIIISILFLFSVSFTFPVFAQETATSTTEIGNNSTPGVENNPDALAPSTPQEETITATTTSSDTADTTQEDVATTTSSNEITENPTISDEVSDESQDNPINPELVPDCSIASDQNLSSTPVDNLESSDGAGAAGNCTPKTLVPTQGSDYPSPSTDPLYSEEEQPSPPPPEPEPPPALPEPEITPVVPFESRNGRAFDPATASSRIIIRVLMSDGNPPPFPVFVTFVGVGRKNYGGKIDANGELKVIMPTGRYYTELLVLNTEYVQGEDGPSFFLEANEERDFGAIKLILASERGQTLEDRTLEANILAEAENAKGVGKILLMIVKLLIKILEEIRSISARI